RSATSGRGAARKELVVLIEQLLTEWIADGLVVIEATVQALHVRGWQEVQDVLLEVRADQVSTALGETGVVKLLEEWRETGRNDRIEYDLCTTGRDLFNCLAIVGVIKGVVLFADYGATIRSDGFAYLRVQHVRPNIVG